ncbi:MAG: lipoate--protein ligase [Thermacetogeniaceae bacterium]
MRTAFASTGSHDPWYNLAVEEYLLNHVAEDEIILYLWQNHNTVVIGKHQNAWKECACTELEREGGKLARRLSGGGAVYHDLGNLNFTFVMDRKLYDLEKQLGVILEAVRRLGIQAEFTGRNDLTVGGKKFSGNAFCFKSRSAYHHGTILVNTDFKKMERYLRVSREKIASKGVDVKSVRARVVNLASLNPAITIEAVWQSLKETFARVYGDYSREIRFDQPCEEVEGLYQKYASWEWRYGETPDFDISLSNRFEWGEVEICLTVEEGLITKAVVYSDAMDCGLVEDLAASLQGIPFRKDVIMERVGSIEAEGREAFVRDLLGWLDTREI